MKKSLLGKSLLVVMIITLVVAAAACSGPAALPTATGSVDTGNQSQDQPPIPDPNPTSTPTPIPTPTPIQEPAPTPSRAMEQFGHERDTTGYVWLNYRVFMNSPEGWPLSDYIQLLQDVLYPVLNEYTAHVGHFHFFRYAGLYSELNEEEVEERLDFRPDQWAHMIKFRVLIKADQENAFDSALSQLCEEADSCLGVETVVGRYDIAADLGKRFGSTRAWHVADLVQSAAILALAFAVDGEVHDPDPGGRGGSSGLVHLVSNTLFYQLYVERTDWDRQDRFWVGP